MLIAEIIDAVIPLKNPFLKTAIEKSARVCYYSRGDVLYDIGDAQKNIYLLWDGILRCYFIDETQAEITDCFMTERGMIVNSPDAFCGEGRTPSVIGVEVLSEATVCEIPIEQVVACMKETPELAKIYIRCLHQAMEFQNEINNKRLYLPGKERYQWFLEKWPEVDRVASNQQIATFLGIRSESLSRLRRQKKENS